MNHSLYHQTMVEMTWPEVEKSIGEGAVVLLPTGVIEEHGPHMSLGVDTYLSTLVSVSAKQQLEAMGIKTLVAPPVYWGINNATGAFPGSFTLRPDTMKALLRDILASLKSWGVTHVFNINWHDDYHQCRTLLDAIAEARVETGIRACTLLSGMLAKRIGVTGRESGVLIYTLPPPREQAGGLDIHAGSGETSVMAAYFPQEVDTGLARTLQSTQLTPEEFAVWRQGWSDARGITPLGYVGDPARFEPEGGRRYVETLCKTMSDLIESYLKGTYKPPLTI